MARVHEGNLLVRQALVPDRDGGPRVLDGRIVGGTTADLHIVNGRIAAIGPSLDAQAADDVLHAGGRSVIPGLHDHHLHLRALAAAGRSVSVGPTSVDGADGMARAMRDAPADSQGWRRAVGYHESVAGDLDRRALDAMVPGALVRVQHRSGVMWVLNSPAIDALGVDGTNDPGIERDGAGHPTGRLFRMDAWLADRLPGDRDPADLSVMSTRQAALGVTGITEATPGATTDGLCELAAAVEGGGVLQRMHLMCPVGVEVPDHPLVSRGPEKFLLDDDRLPPLDAFAGSIARAHDHGVRVAVHCVTAVQLVFAMTGLGIAGSCRGDRIEHGAVVPPGLLENMKSSAVTVVLNPSLLFERGDTYLADVDERDRADLLRGASLLAAGIPVAGGTDAPFGSFDPWIGVAAAHRRTTRDGARLGPGEALDETHALQLFTGYGHDPARPRRIAVGEPGDLCLLDGDALPAPVADGQVAATVVAGRVVHRLT